MFGSCFLLARIQLNENNHNRTRGAFVCGLEKTIWVAIGDDAPLANLHIYWKKEGEATYLGCPLDSPPLFLVSQTGKAAAALMLASAGREMERVSKGWKRG